MRTLIAVSICSVLAAGCACASMPPEDAQPRDPTKGSAQVPETPAAKCLALAGVPRERKPNEPDRIGVRHVLVKYKGSRSAAETIARTREDACLRALEARDKILGGADFDAIVKEYSDEPGAADRRGSLGAVERKDVVPPFADAAFELSVGQMSDVVETDSGFHLILRSE